MVRMIYFAHPVSDYGTAHEAACLAAIEAAYATADVDVDVYNPNCPAGARAYERYGMAYFEQVVGMCSALVFRSFGDGAIGAGVATEVARAFTLGIPVFELVEGSHSHRLHMVPRAHLDPARVLDVPQTRARLVGRRAA